MAPPPFNRPSGGGFRPGPKPPFKKPGFKREEEQPTDGPRVNGQIRVPQVRVIGHDGEQLGILTPAEAIAMAEARGLDLVEVSPTASPPVCKILDFGKYRYELQKKAKEARKKQKVIEIKEIKLRPNIDTNDYNVKLRAIHKFLEEGDKVKVTLRLRGREMAHMDIAMDLLKKLQDDVASAAKIEAAPKPEGRQVVMVLAPLK